MKTKTINIYSFSELSDDAKQKAIENWRNTCEDDCYFVWEHIKEGAKEIGLIIQSLEDHRPNRGEFKISANEVAANIFSNHGQQCETYKTAREFMDQWEPFFEDYMDKNSEGYESRENENKLQELEDEFLQSLLEDYRIMYNNEYEYQNSDEAITETIEANEHEFDENGKRH